MAALDFDNSPNTESSVSTGDITWKLSKNASDGTPIWYATTDATQIIHVGVSAPDPARTGQMWWCSATTDEGGGRLYVYFDDVWVDASLPGGGQGGDFLSKTEDDTAAGAITFEGLTTHEGGVEVTGGSFGVTGTATAYITGTYSGDDARSLLISPGLSGDSAVCSGIRIGRGPDNGFSRTDYRGIHISDIKTTDADKSRYGVWSDLGTGSGTNYNFYAAGSAPNYFAGDILQGNSIDGALDPGDNAMRMQSGVLRVCCSSSEKGRSAVSLLRAYSHQGVYIAFSSAATGDTDWGSAAASIRLEGQGNVITDNITNTFRVSRNAAAPAQITNAVETIKALSPGLTSFAAQDLIDNAPSVVVSNHEDEDYISVDETKLIPLLTKALQEALNRIEALESNEVVDDATDSALLTLVANLSTRVTALEGA